LEPASQPFRPSRAGPSVGTIVALLLTLAALLASRDLWNLEARAIGRLLTFAGVEHRVVTSPDDLSDIRIGFDSRAEHLSAPDGPAVIFQPKETRRARPSEAVAAIVALAALIAVMRSRDLPLPARGGALLAALITALTVAYGTWWSKFAPISSGANLVDWRTSAVAPCLVVAFVCALDIAVLPFGALLSPAWTVLAIAATAVFSVVRYATQIAGLNAFGPAGFLAMHQIAGPFLDLVPGFTVIGLAYAVLPTRRATAR
jgi:hypothetical protein